MIQVVCIKQVADTETRVKVAADGRTLDPAGVTWILNPYDEFAVEQALRVQGAGRRGRGDRRSRSAAPACRPRSATRSPWAPTARSTSRPTRRPRRARRRARARRRDPGARRPDLVWCGRQAVDDDAAQVGPMLAELLDLPCVTAVAKFELDGEARPSSSATSRAAARWSRSTLPAVLHHRQGPERAALRLAQGHHGGQEEADRGEARRTRRARTSRSLALELPPARAGGPHRRPGRRARCASWCACCARRRSSCERPRLHRAARRAGALRLARGAGRGHAARARAFGGEVVGVCPARGRSGARLARRRRRRPRAARRRTPAFARYDAAGYAAAVVAAARA